MSNFGWSYPPGVSGTPADDEPDWIDEADKWIALRNADESFPKDESEAELYELIRGLREVIHDECGL